MNKEQILDDLAKSVLNRKTDLAKSAATATLDEGVDPVKATNEGLVTGMNVVGNRHAEHKVYLPRVPLSAGCLYCGLEILIPAIPKEALAESKKAETVIVEGDVHDIVTPGCGVPPGTSNGNMSAPVGALRSRCRHPVRFRDVNDSRYPCSYNGRDNSDIGG